MDKTRSTFGVLERARGGKGIISCLSYSYGKAMDGMDKIYDGHTWCKTKKKNKYS